MSDNSEKHGGFDENTSVFVGRLPKRMTEEQIKDTFLSCGPISRIIVQYYDNGQSKGSCFIEFEDENGAKRACTRDGSMIQSNYIRVNMAASKPQKGLYSFILFNYYM